MHGNKDQASGESGRSIKIFIATETAVLSTMGLATRHFIAVRMLYTSEDIRDEWFGVPDWGIAGSPNGSLKCFGRSLDT